MNESSDPTQGAATPGERARWIAAISYIPFVCFFSLGKGREDPFIKFHASQGFLLFVAEVVSLIFIVIFETTIGKIRFIGILIVGLLQLGIGLSALTVSVIGFIKALFGEYWHMPFLGEYRKNVPHMRDV